MLEGQKVLKQCDFHCFSSLIMKSASNLFKDCHTQFHQCRKTVTRASDAHWAMVRCLCRFKMLKRFTYLNPITGVEYRDPELFL